MGLSFLYDVFGEKQMFATTAAFVLSSLASSGQAAPVRVLSAPVFVIEEGKSQLQNKVTRQILEKYPMMVQPGKVPTRPAPRIELQTERAVQRMPNLLENEFPDIAKSQRLAKSHLAIGQPK